MTIVAVAIHDRAADEVYSTPAPARHVHLATEMRQMGQEGVWNELVYVRGFLDEKGAFLSRMDALAHVCEIDQPLKNAPNSNMGLFSEDLW